MCNFGQWPSFMPKYGNFENLPIFWKLVPVEQKLAQCRSPGVERQYMYNCWNFFKYYTKRLFTFFRILGRNSKTAHHRAKQFDNVALVGVCSMPVGNFDLEHVKVIWIHSVHFSKNWAVTQKWAHHRVKWAEIWALGIVCSMYVFYL